MNKPKTRNENIVIQEMNKEILIYDLKANKAFCLNETSAMIYQLCDGTKTIADISNLMTQKLKTLVNEDLVRLALSELKRDGLLESAGEFANYSASLSRRELVRKAGLASMVALPLVLSISAPHAVQSASTCLGLGIPFCSPAPQPDFDACITYLQANLGPICCSGASGFTNFDPGSGSCCGQCDGV
jgi:hypothetical protein